MNICHRVEVDRIFKQYRPDTVMHLVAEPHVDQCVDGAADFIHTNIGGTYTLLEPARDYWMRLFLPGVRFGCVGADAEYGKAPQFRRSLAERALFFAVGILPQQRVYPADVVMRPPVRKRPGVRPPVHPTPSVESIQAQAMIASLGEDAFQEVTWRRGTKGPLRAKFAAVRIRMAEGTSIGRGRRAPAEEVLWLVCEWRKKG